jgi:hypothetical protein
LLIALLGALSCRSRSVGTAERETAPCPTACPVPAQQARIYQQQSEWLAEYRAAVDAHLPGARSRPIFGGHLLTADSNRADALLQPDAMKWVELSLDRFQQLGIRGVTLNLGYPLLMPWFPKSARYLKYYQNVAREVRKRGMQLAVEQIILYSGSAFTPFDFELGDMTLEKYTAEQAQMGQIILDELAPDHLTILHEPDTVAELTGLRTVLDPEVATAYVKEALAKLKRGDTKIGAGSGSWSSPAFAEAFAKIPGVDYIDIHIYWIDPGSIARAYAMAESANSRGKPVVFTEVGLYKSLGEGREGMPLGEDFEKDPNVEGVVAVYRRDVFSFWEPLDIEFLDVTARLAKSVDTLFVSVYWTNMFFSYIDWTRETAGMSYQQLNAQLSGQRTAEAWLAGRFTCAGRAYQAIIEGNR